MNSNNVKKKILKEERASFNKVYCVKDDHRKMFHISGRIWGTKRISLIVVEHKVEIKVKNYIYYYILDKHCLLNSVQWTPLSILTGS